MPQALYDVFGGYSIEGKAHSLQGITPELGVRADTIAAPVASTYSNSSDQSLWIKVSTGNGDSTDWKKLATEDYANSISTQMSWREPAVVNDKVTTVVPASLGTPTPNTTIDGETITDGGRVLFSAITAGLGKNVYIWEANTGSWIEDTNTETVGDALYITDGSHAGHVYAYNNASSWVQIDQSASGTDITNLMNFVGKPASGTGMPQYSSNNLLVNDEDLRTSLGKVDGSLGDGGVTNSTGFVLTSDLTWGGGTLNTTTALEALNVGLGDRQYTGNHYLTDSETITSSLNKLDVALNNVATGSGLGDGVISDKGNFFVLTDDLEIGTGAISVTDAFDLFNKGIGNRDYTDSLIVTDGESVTDSIEKLSVAIGARTYTAGLVLTDNEAVGSSLNKINTAIGDRAYTDNLVIADGQTITASLEALSVATGNRVYTGASFLTSAESVSASLLSLDTAIQAAGVAVRAHVSGTTPATFTPILKAGTGNISGQWHVVIKEVATNKTTSLEVNGVTDGTTTDYSGSGVLRLNSGVDGLEYQVLLVGGELELQIKSTNACNVSSTLVVAEKFA